MERTDFPLTYIIILNWNGLRDTLECLESVSNLDYPNFVVIVVDNNSTDNSVNIIPKEYPTVTLIKNKQNLGFTGGNNVGIRYGMRCGADYFWLLNNDTTVEPDTLRQLVFAAEESPNIGLVSPVIYYYADPKQIQFCGHYMSKGGLNFQSFSDLESLRQGNKDRKTLLWGTALLIKKDVVEKIGDLDEPFFAYWEDIDYSLRALKAKYENVVCESAKIYHKMAFHSSHKRTRGAYYYFYTSRNRYFLYTKNFKDTSKLLIWKNYIGSVLKEAVACYRDNNEEAVNACLDGVWAAMNNIRGPWNRNIKMPARYKNIFYFFFLRHPFFWAHLLRGEYIKVASEGLKRIKDGIFRIVG